MERESIEEVYEAGREAVIDLVEGLLARVDELSTEVAELRARLDQNSRNSSKPPSSDGYAKPPAPKSLRRPSGRKPGGQSGHRGHHLKQVESPDEVIHHVPDRCTGCGAELRGAELAGEEVRQIFDLPEIRLAVSEHRAQRKRCSCGQLSRADFPAGVDAPAQYGPALRGLVLYLIVYQHLPYERAAQLLSDWLGAPLSTGTLAAIVERCGAGLGRFDEQVREEILKSPVIGFDETGARVAGRLRWVHSASTDQWTLYAIHERRGKGGIENLGVLGVYDGVAVHDGWLSYRNYESVTHALCNVHHLRELQGAIEGDPKTQGWAAAMDELLRELKRTVDAAREAGATALPASVTAAFERRYELIIELGHEQNPPPKRIGKRGPLARSKTANLHRRLDQDRDAVLRFAYDFRIPFDNNQSERDLRMIKLQQKISGCWRTSGGADRFLAMRSYLSSTRKQGRGIIDALSRLAEQDPWLPQGAEP